MSSPIHNGDKLEALELYAPPWVRDQAPAAAAIRTAQPQAAQLQTAPPPDEPWVAEDPMEPDSVPSNLEPPAVTGPPVQSQSRSDVSTASAGQGIGGRNNHDGAGGRFKIEEPYSAAALWPDLVKAARNSAENQEVRTARIEPPPSPARSVNKPQPRMPKGGPNLAPPQAAQSLRREPPRSEGSKALRLRLPRETETVLAPPVLKQRKSLMPLLGRAGLMVVFAATVAYAITFYSIPETRRAFVNPDGGAQDQTTVGAADSSFVEVPATKMRMVIEGRQAFANEPIPLGVSLIGTPNGEFALLTGLTAGTKLSVGTALNDTSWRLAARDLPTAVAYAPKDYVGVMNAAIDLRSSSDSILDRNVMRLEWLGNSSENRAIAARSDRNAAVRPAMAVQSIDKAVQPIDKEEIETLLRRGVEYIKGGDIAAARLVLHRAAGSGSSRAALALGATFDPYVFSELGVVGFGADPVQARFWYEQAGKLGEREAAPRIDRLMKLGQ